jgi:hypothetical protein
MGFLPEMASFVQILSYRERTETAIRSLPLYLT